MLADLKFAVRQLAQSPGFTLIAVLTLALGIGANTAIFSFINAFFLKNFTVRQPEELVSAYLTDERNPGFLPISHLNFADYRGLWASRTGAALLSIFGLLAPLLAAIGVYGIMSYTVGKRTREIGIRMAIGAQRGDVLQLVLNQSLVIAGLGLITGLGAAFLAARYFQNFLLGVGAGDVLTYAAITLILSTVALLACLLPALRAAKVDPLIALRTE